MTPHPRQSALARVLSRIVTAPIHVYRYAISPLLPPSCRYFPSCSEYALEAVQRHGPLTGAALAAARVCRCHPWSSGGVDPVPDSVQPLRALCARWPAALRGGNSAKAD